MNTPEYCPRRAPVPAGISLPVAAIAMAAIGMLMKNTQGQDRYSVMMPPGNTPAVPPAGAAAPYRASAFGQLPGLGAEQDLCWCQLRDMKGAAVVDTMSALAMEFYPGCAGKPSPARTPDPKTRWR